MTSSGFTFRNMLILIGIVVASIGIIYFATVFIDRISEWGRLASTVLLVIVFVSLGLHFEAAEDAPHDLRSGWEWLRITTALYVLGLLSALVAVVVFLGMEQVDRVIKVLATILVGLGLILVAGKRYGLRPPAARP